VAALSLVLVAAAPAAADRSSSGSKAVYTITNDAAGNALAVFDRAADGTLRPAGTVPTGGLGSGGGLGNQGALALSNSDRFLFAVNAGSNDISSFRVGSQGPELVDRIGSGGAMPISIAVEGRLLYVLNAGAGAVPGSISGFRIERQGTLEAIPGSTRPLSAAAVGPAQIEFDPRGRALVVTEKDTNLITTYVVGRDGLATGPNAQPSNGATPFGFAFDKRGHLIVSEAFGGAASALSSYDVDRAGDLDTISASVAAGAEKAACWVVVTGNARYAYTTNTGTGSVSGYSVGRDGSLSLLDADAITATTGGAPIDAALTDNDKFLYVLNSSLNRIDAFRVQSDGSLAPLPSAGVSGLPASTNGLVAD
jgi:6-phosphogluconolactonase (cycloisomerase 2 family)